MSCVRTFVVKDAEYYYYSLQNLSVGMRQSTNNPSPDMCEKV